MRTLIQFTDLVPGCWYIPCFQRIENDEVRTDSPYYKYLGDKEFETESGDHVDCFFDPELQARVAVDAPDGFVQ